VGLSAKFTPRFKLDFAYVNKMARSRVGNLFGPNSNSFLVTFTLDYGRVKSSPTPDRGKGTKNSYI
jgi:hypothetical protein